MAAMLRGAGRGPYGNWGLGGRDKLQAAFDQHLDAMLANPAEPARIKLRDDKGNWSEEYVLVHAGTMKAGDRESWEDEAIPRYKNARRARVTAEWTVQGGGTYWTVKEFLFK